MNSPIVQEFLSHHHQRYCCYQINCGELSIITNDDHAHTFGNRGTYTSGVFEKLNTLLFIRYILNNCTIRCITGINLIVATALVPAIDPFVTGLMQQF